MRLFQKNHLILYIKDIPLYNISTCEVLSYNHLPEIIAKNPTENSFNLWKSHRKSSDSNQTAVALMNIAFGHNSYRVVRDTKLLSLSDCYWVKYENDKTSFNSITPYLEKFWGHNFAHKYNGVAVPTLVTNGILDKHWISKEYLQKPYSKIEYDCYILCKLLGIPVAEYILETGRLLTKNFTNIDNYLEPAHSYNLYSNQGYMSVDIINDFDFGLEMIILDAIIKNTDRHTGNFGYLVNIETGQKVQAPLFDFEKALNPEFPNDYMIENLLELFKDMGKPKFVRDTINKMVTTISDNFDILHGEFVTRAKILEHQLSRL
ncbi:MAG: hypothetical protein BEN18_07985 [Epulopiscium sp. Nuni2H_MBin001]|nr:MAG: hypothetical protein BEN18_07985 [Epulopiscium sp. Nuni2H_MBin001]